MFVDTRLVDYRDPEQARALLRLLREYALDPMGGGAPEPVQATLINELAKRPHAFSILAYRGSRAVGLANCLEGFSTFAARPLINVHDLVVQRDYRGMGVGRTLLNQVAAEARSRGCCKLTLEVLSGNQPARRLYEGLGFHRYQLDPAAGCAEFWEKPL
ncbi:MAG: GNAT family N-acetyltransferase [Pseudomonadales bacterium]|nr:GNAT family N-acetyltransferase [Pseudomonadales bacterium]